MREINYLTLYLNRRHPFNKAGDGPESPEVTLMVEELNKSFNNSLLQKILLHSGKYKKNKTLSEEVNKLSKYLPLKINCIDNKGKFVFIELNKGWALGITPGMTGHFYIPKVTNTFKTMEGYVYNPKYNHIEFVTNNGSFFFNDPRLFGRLYIYSPVDKKNTLDIKLDSLGPDLLKDLPKLKQEEFSRYISIKKGI
jgi:formamidopyrimidine-DNA glycosylase